MLHYKILTRVDFAFKYDFYIAAKLVDQDFVRVRMQVSASDCTDNELLALSRSTHEKVTFISKMFDDSVTANLYDEVYFNNSELYCETYQV